MLSIGLMSGTSMDGIDAALLDTDGTPKLLSEIAHTTLKYPNACKTLLKAAEYAVRQCQGDMTSARDTFPAKLRAYLKNILRISATHLDSTIGELAQYLHGSSKTAITLNDIVQHSTILHANAVKQLLDQTQLQAKDIRVIGYHGQALFHRPKAGISVIIGDGQVLAEQLAIPVVNDFRRRDIEAGGLGAPFAPVFHQALAIRDNATLPLAVVNCGGIANISIIDASGTVAGFDTGPGNALLDSIVRQRTHGQENMDTDGRYAAQGHINLDVFNALYAHSTQQAGQNFFKLSPPKSLDYGDMHLIDVLDTLSLPDACATLAAFTADSIVNSVHLLDSPPPAHWILAGGGWNNPVIVKELKTRLAQIIGPSTVQTADQVGWNSQYMEAQLFAYLAVRSLQNQPLSLPNTTGVKEPMTGGQLYVPLT